MNSVRSGPIDTEAIVAEVAAAVGLAEGPGGVRDIVRAIVRHEPVAAREISRHAELPVPLVTAVSNELRKRGVVSRDRPVQLTDEGRAAFGKGQLLAAKPCPECDGTGEVRPPEVAVLTEELRAIAAAQPEVKVEIDQTHCTVESKVKRVLLLAEFGALDKRVVFIGDDDLTSLALARFAAMTGAASARFAITVVDVDPDLLAFIASEADRLGVAIDTVRHDLTEPLPEQVLGRFDMAFTDPPYTVPGARLFLSRAVTALESGGGQHLFFAFGARRPDETNEVQAGIAAMGLATRSLTPNFTEYEGAGILGGTSHLYHLRTTGNTVPLVDGQHTGVLYTADTRSARSRPYQCAQCRSVFKVGPGERFTHIAKLKDAGCPECGADKFRPLALSTQSET